MAKGKLPLTNLPNWLLTLLFLIAVIGQNIFIILVVIFIGVMIYIQFNKPEKKSRRKIKKVAKESGAISIGEEFYITTTQHNHAWPFTIILESNVDYFEIEFELLENGLMKISEDNLVSYYVKSINTNLSCN